MPRIKTYDKQGNALYGLYSEHEIGRGGEGIILTLPNNQNLVAKMYLPGCVNINEAKFNYLNKLPAKLFIRPQELLFGKNGEILGFTMEYLQHDYFPLDALFSKSNCQQYGITSQIKEKISKQLIEAVEVAHQLKITIGDLSGLNIMTNNKGDVKFIDVDSYEVPGFKHSDKLLRDIRDWFKGGRVCVEADFFSLSVVIFNYLTFLHPFKGVHKKCHQIEHRMIQKLPVFVKDPDLIIPKCYIPLSDSYLQNQFEKLYLNGDRFLLSIDKLMQPVMGKKVPAVAFKEKDVQIQNMLSGVEIEYSFFSISQGVIRTKDEYIIFDNNTSGLFFLKNRLNRKEYIDVFVGDQSIILVDSNYKLFTYDKSTHKTSEIKNIQLNPGARFVHIGNVILMVSDDTMYKIYIDEIKYNNIRFERIDVFGPGFNTRQGVIQNVGGVFYLHYSNGDSVAIVKSPLQPRATYQVKDTGIMQYEENKQTKYKFFNVNNGNITMYQEIDNLHQFAYRGKNLKDSFIFVPQDNKIEVLRSLDFYKVADIECSIIDTTTKLYNTNAGIIAVNDDNVWLINKK